MVDRSYIPVFAPKTRDADDCVRFVSLPDKNTVLKEHLLSMEYPAEENEVLDMKLMLFQRDVCDKVDSKAPATAKPFLLANTANFK